MMQPRFERRTGSTPLTLVEQPRFRAGFDFLRLRGDVGEVDVALADWWEEFCQAGDEERADLIDSVRETRGPRRVKREADARAGRPGRWHAPRRPKQPRDAPRRRTEARRAAIRRGRAPASAPPRRASAVAGAAAAAEPAGTPIVRPMARADDGGRGASDAFVGLGANLGDRARVLERACARAGRAAADDTASRARRCTARRRSTRRRPTTSTPSPTLRDRARAARAARMRCRRSSACTAASGRSATRRARSTSTCCCTATRHIDDAGADRAASAHARARLRAGAAGRDARPMARCPGLAARVATCARRESPSQPHR